EVEGAELGGADRCVDGRVAGNHDDRGRMRKSLDAGEGFEAVDAGKPDVQEDDVEAALRCALDGAFGGFGHFGDVAFIGEDVREVFGDYVYIVKDKDIRFGRHAR